MIWWTDDNAEKKNDSLQTDQSVNHFVNHFTLDSIGTTVMDFWVMKAKRPAAIVAEWVQQGGMDTWWTKRRPRRLKIHDRLFVWKGGASPFLIGIAECMSVRQKPNRAGKYTFDIRYLTDAFDPRLTINTLRKDSILKNESFLKVGPSGTLYLLSQDHGKHLELLARRSRLVTQEALRSDLNDRPESIPDLDIRTTGEKIRERKLRAHIRKERSPALRAACLIVARKKGPLNCEVCGFVFGDLPREVAGACCEVHHKIPVSSLSPGAMVRLKDLAVVCSNCHRMLHAKNPPFTLRQLNTKLA